MTSEPVKEDNKVSWKDLATAETPVSETTAASAPQKVSLNSNTKKILEEAGSNAASALFKTPKE